MVGAVVAENRTPRGAREDTAIPAVRPSKIGTARSRRQPIRARLLGCSLAYFAYLFCLVCFCSLGGAGNHDFDGDALSLGPKRRPTLVLEDEGASRVDGVSREDSFVGLACDRAGLATLSVDEANDRSARTHRPGRPSRAGRSLLALFALGAGELLLFARSEARRVGKECRSRRSGDREHRRASSD